jgi:hypothetical protein
MNSIFVLITGALLYSLGRRWYKIQKNVARARKTGLKVVILRESWPFALFPSLIAADLY